MSQYGEGTKTQNIYVEKPEDKKEISVRLSLFYDGTLNNRVNVKEKEKLSKIYYEFREEGEPTSYDNGKTNIAIMEPHCEDTSDGYDIVLKEYIEGQGTFNLEGDELMGYAMGGFDSGVASRAEQGITRAVGLIAKNVKSNKMAIKKLTIDVFGFSRGSATARYAIYLVLKGSSHQGASDLGQGYTQDVRPIIESVANTGIEIQESAVEICFAGLYDTVLSVYGSQNLPFKWVGNILKQKAVKHAKKVLHLAASDEHRHDFPLHNIRSAGGKGEEYYLPGVHSDVGGSYNQASELAIEAEPDPNKKVYMQTTSENKVILKNTNRKILENDMQDLIKLGWYINDQNKKEISISAKKVRKFRNGKVPYYTNKYELKIDRDGICSAYCNIPLKIMAKYARDKDVKLNFNLKLDDRAEVILKPHSDLTTLEGKIKEYMNEKKGNGKSKAEDWVGENQELNNYIIKNKIRHNHFNFSSKPGAGYSPRIKNYKRVRNIYDA